MVVRSAGTSASRAEVDGLRGSREAAADPRARVFVIFLDTYHTQLDGSAMMRKPLVAFLDRVLGPDDLVALMTPEMAGSDISLGPEDRRHRTDRQRGVGGGDGRVWPTRMRKSCSTNGALRPRA